VRQQEGFPSRVKRCPKSVIRPIYLPAIHAPCAIRRAQYCRYIRGSSAHNYVSSVSGVSEDNDKLVLKTAPNAYNWETIGEGSIRNPLDPSEGDRENNRLRLNARPTPAFVILWSVTGRPQYKGHSIDHVEVQCNEYLTLSPNPLVSNRISPALVQNARLVGSN
jgi:hypothetical protein